MSKETHIQLGLLSADKESREFIAHAFGKRGQKSDISLYTLRARELLTTIVPDAYPDKPLALVTAAHMSDIVVVGAGAGGIDASVGEAAILADCLGLNGINAVMGDNVTGFNYLLDKMKKTFSKLSTSSWDHIMVSNNAELAELRDRLTNLYAGPRGKSDDYLAIEVDHAFPVTGVGSVILGTIVSGTVEKGMRIRILPGNQVGSVRNIQVNDADAKSAGSGIHVGLAMKGILPKNLVRGTVITAEKEDMVEERELLEMGINNAAFGKPPASGDVVHVMAGLYSTPAKIESWNSTVVVKLDKSIPFYPDMRITVLDLNKKPAILGSRKI